MKHPNRKHNSIKAKIHLPAFMPADETQFLRWANTFLNALHVYLNLFQVDPATYQTLLNCLQDTLNLRETITRFESILLELYQRKNMKLYDFTPSMLAEAALIQTASTPADLGPTAFIKLLKTEITRIKNHPEYTPNIGQALGIETANRRNGRTFSHLIPRLNVTHDNFNTVIKWRKNGAKALQLYADHGTGELRPHSVILRTTYKDPTPLPAQDQIWRYQGAYIRNDEVTGWLSAIRKIVVKRNN
jgi:hypothetical protein